MSYGDGGGISLSNATDNGIAVNSVFFNNKTLDKGAGIYNNGAQVINCTVVNNHSTNDAAGIYNTSSALVKNTVIWGNVADNSDPQINSSGTITYTASEGDLVSGAFNYSLNQANTGQVESPYFKMPTSFIGLSNGNATYKTELENADWDIETSSYLIGKGDDLNAPDTDIDNISRENDAIGAYENSASENATSITLSSFNATVKNGLVTLTWTSSTETENAYFILYKNGKAIANIGGAGTSTNENTYEFIDSEISAGSYKYMLADVNYAGVEKQHKKHAIEIIVRNNELMPSIYSLADAYPNPFNPSTTIGYSIKERTDVTITIFDLSGRAVFNHSQNQQEAGWYEFRWNGTSSSGYELGSGIYLYSIIANDFIQTKKMIKMK